MNFNADSCVVAGNYNEYYPVFEGDSNLTTINFGNNVKVIPSALCFNCDGLTGTLTIPNSVTWMGTYAFYGCSDLSTVVIGNGVNTLPNYVFYGCNHITNLTIGSGVQIIEANAFSGCNAVLDMHVRASVPPTSTSNPFSSFNTGIPVHVPCSSVTAYQNAQYWSLFTNIIGQYFSLSVAPQDTNMGYVTVTTEPDCSNNQAQFSATAYDGFHFVQWSDGDTQNPRTVTVTSDTTFIAYFAIDIQTYTLTVVSADTSMGSVSGGGSYDEGTDATITATANSGYHFVQWQDGDTQNPRTVTVTSDTTFIAYFEADSTEGINSAIDATQPTVYAIGDCIVVETGGNEPVRVYDIMGRLVATLQTDGSGKQEIRTERGVYLVRICNRLAHKVVVM